MAICQHPLNTVQIKAPAVATVGQPTSATVIVTATSPYKITREYPFKLRLAKRADLRVHQAKPEVSDTRLTLRATLTYRQSGRQRTRGKVHFSVCDAEQCLVRAKEISWQVTVRP